MFAISSWSILCPNHRNRSMSLVLDCTSFACICVYSIGVFFSSPIRSKLKALREKAGLESNNNPYSSSGSEVMVGHSSSGISSAGSSASSSSNMYRISNFSAASAETAASEDYSSSSASTLVQESQASSAPSEAADSGMDDIRRRFV